MTFFRRNPPAAFGVLGLFCLSCVSGCSGNWCFAGISNNGNGSLFVGAGGPATCPPSQPMGTISMEVVTTPPCANCFEVKHIYVTIKSVQLRPASTNKIEETNPHGSDVIIPVRSPQIDLISDSPPPLILNKVPVPAVGYDGLKVKFLPSSSENGETISENRCGGNQLNCVITSDGSIELLQWADEDLEMEPAFFIGGLQGSSFLLPPGSAANLRLRFELKSFYSYDNSGWRVRYMLDGKAGVERQPQADQSF